MSWLFFIAQEYSMFTFYPVNKYSSVQSLGQLYVFFKNGVTNVLTRDSKYLLKVAIIKFAKYFMRRILPWSIAFDSTHLAKALKSVTFHFLI